MKMKRVPDDSLEIERLEKMLQRETRLWEKGYLSIAGVDEAGRGPLAGPVVAAGVILTRKKHIEDILVWRDLNDSKQLSQKKREQLYKVIMEHAAAVGVGIVEADVIDEINIRQASFEAMRLALMQLDPASAPDFVLADGFLIPGLDLPQEAVIGGDRASLSIAAASVIAKVTRDRLMEEYDKQYPGYGFAQNKGYPTAEHRKAIKSLGFTALHRKSFRVR